MQNIANAEQLQELAAYMASQINVPTIGIGGGYAPIGTVISVMGTTAPQDYLACDGTAYNISTYPQLADYFEAQFGSKNFFGGNGTTTFAVPDLRGEVLRGTGTNSHTNQGSGANVGVHQDATEHTSNYSSPGYIGVIGDRYHTTESDITDRGKNHDNKWKSEDAYYDTAQAGTGAAASGDFSTYTSRPTNTSVLYCIKAVVAGEVYSTEERVVGTWIDSKPIYQKTVNFGTLPNSNTKKVSHNVLNMSKIISLYGICDNGEVFMPLPLCTPVGVEYTIQLRADYTDVIIFTGIDRSSFSAYVVIQYTKTTD